MCVWQHAHAHTVVPAGGLSRDRRRWIDSPSKSFFLPKDVLAEVFRGKFVDGLQKAFAEGRLRCCGQFARCLDLAPSKPLCERCTATIGSSSCDLPSEVRGKRYAT